MRKSSISDIGYLCHNHILIHHFRFWQRQQGLDETVEVGRKLISQVSHDECFNVFQQVV